MSSFHKGKLCIQIFTEIIYFYILNNSNNNYSLWISTQKFNKSAWNIILTSVVLLNYNVL